MSLTLDQAITFQSFDWKSVDVRVIPVLSEPLTIVDCQLVRAKKKKEKRKRKVDLTSRLDDSSNAGTLMFSMVLHRIEKVDFRSSRCTGLLALTGMATVLE